MNQAGLWLDAFDDFRSDQPVRPPSPQSFSCVPSFSNPSLLGGGAVADGEPKAAGEVGHLGTPVAAGLGCTREADPLCQRKKS